MYGYFVYRYVNSFVNFNEEDPFPQYFHINSCNLSCSIKRFFLMKHLTVQIEKNVILFFRLHSINSNSVP